MSDAAGLLSYAVRPRVLARYLGQLGLVLAILTLAPLAAALVFRDYGVAGRYLLVVAMLVAAAAPAAKRAAPRNVQANEALTIIALTFVATPVLMAFPIMGAGLTLSEALFEGVSAVTTTGLTTLTGVESLPRSFLFTRAWMQWCGGLGFVVLLIALLMGHQAAARRLAEPYAAETLPTTARTHARRMLGVYLTLTFLGLLILWIALDDGFAALVHVLTAVSTGGFSPYDQSLAELASWGARYAVVGVALLGAIPLPLYLRGRYRRGQFFRDGELRALILAILTVGIVVSLLLHRGGASVTDALRHGFLLGISAQTTTGYASMDLEGLAPAAQLVLIAAMFVGGGLGSTAGGVKVFRFLILLKLLHLEIRRTARSPHAVTPEARLGGKPLTGDDIERALLLISLYAAAALTSWFAFLALGQPPIESLFEVVSALGTVGLSTGLTGADLAPVLKTVLAVDMLLGRLEIVALLVLLYPRNWVGSRMD